MSLAEVLERAAVALPGDADVIRPANGDPVHLLELLGPEAAERVLHWLLTHEPEGGAEVVESWFEHAKGVELLAQVDEAVLPKAGRKILRRVRHRLRASGIEVPDAAGRAESGVRRLPEIEDNLELAYVSPLGPRGSRPVYLVERNPSGGARLFEVLLDEVRGVVDCEVYTAGRSRVRDFVKEIVRRPQLPAVPVEPASARALIARVAAGQPADRPLPRNFGEWRSRIAVAAEEIPTPGEQARAVLGEGSVAGGLERAVELVREGELGPWAPSLERVGEIGESHVDDAGDDFSSLAGELCRGDFGLRTAARFEESSYPLWKFGREADARACLAAATAFRECAPEENVVAVALCEVLLAPVLDALRKPRGVDRGTSGGGET
jgi:hypothetical protein